MTDVLSKNHEEKQQSTKVSTGVNEQVGSSNASSNFNINIPNKYIRRHDEDSDTDLTEAFNL